MSVKTVFLSSASKDLTEYREAAYHAIERLDGYHCVRMEDFGARNWRADAFCRAKVGECDVLVGIVGHCHGSCPPDSHQSYTEREYDAAVDTGVPCLMFLAPEDFPLPAKLIEPDEQRRRQAAFRDRVSGDCIRATFSSPDDLGALVAEAIHNWARAAAAIQARSAATRAEGVIPVPPQPYFAHPYPLQENFTGRVKQRQMLTSWLVEDERPLLALTAIGGMGKSALAWAWLQRDVLGLPLPGQSHDAPEVAAACRVPDGARPDGGLWWSFYERQAGFATFLDAALTYASGGLDPRASPSDYEKVQALVSLVRQKRLLLVLDGFERELRAYASISAAYQGDDAAKDPGGDPRACTDPHASTFLQSLAAGALQSRVLLTSRLFPRCLDGLPACRRETLTALDPEEAVAFFRAQGVLGTRAEIEAACKPYGYLPLALRLLAGVIVKDKRKPGDVSVAGRHPVLPELKGKEQHHILQVAYDALDKQKRTLMSRIAAFRSAMGYEALSVVNPYESDKEFDAALDELTDRGLLFFDRERGRYDVHPIVRQYAYDRLVDKKGVHTRLRDYFAAVPVPDEKAVQTLDDLAPVIELYHHTVGAGRYDEACDLLDERLVPRPLFHRFGAYQTCIELLRALFPDGEDRPPRLKKEGDQGWTLNGLAASYSLSGQSRRAVPLKERQIAIAERQGHKINTAVSLANLADDQFKLAELGAAEANLGRCMHLCREAGDDLNEARVHNEMGRLLGSRGAFVEAARELDAAESTFRQHGDAQGRCIVWSYRAQRALLMGEAKAALEAAHRARKLADEVAATRYPVERDFIRAEWLLGAALVALASEQRRRRADLLSEAETHLTEGITRCRRINMVEMEPDILLAWARWHRAQGNVPEAADHAKEGLTIADRCEYRLAQADIHNFLARLAPEQHDREAAGEHAATAYERAWCDGPPHCYKPALEEAERLLDELGVPPPRLKAKG